MNRLLLAAALLLAAPAALDAQAGASPFLPPGHWSVSAVDRLHAQGLTPPGIHRGERSRSVAQVRLALVEAVRRAPENPVAAGYLARFQEEFQTDSVPVSSLTHASAAGGVGVIEGDVAPGYYTTWGEENWTGAIAREDRTTAVAAGAISAQLGRYLAAGAVISSGPVRTRLDEAYGTARIGPFGVWGGRRMIGYGTATSGLTLAGSAPLDGGAIFLAEPIYLPWILRYLGPIRGEVGLGVMDPSGPVEQPWFVTTRGTFEPHPRFGVGFTRGAMIGDEVAEFRLEDILLILVGGQADGSEYDNQVVSVEGWFRPPLGDFPLLLFLDWGAEDAAGGWWDAPAVVAGFEVAALPGLPGVSLQVERADFTGSRKSNPPWYRHPIGFHEGWTSRGVLLGHPLGGHGNEWLVEVRSTSHMGRVQLAARGFTRNRKAENLYAPEREGRSNGGSLRADLLLRHGFNLELFGSLESGERDWTRSELSAALRVYAPRN